MSPFAVKAIQLLLSLSLLIVLHELGHFIPAKLFKTRVEKFYLFFDVKFSLFKKKIGETVYGIGWLPLGGYIKIAGMIDESMDQEQMAGPPQPWEFRSKPAWQRLIIMLGGVTVNIIVGFVIYMGILYVYGKNITTNEDLPQGFAITEQFEEYGFRNGDQVLKVNGEPLENVLDINKFIFLRDVSNVEVKHADGTIETIQVPEDAGSKMFQNGTMHAFEPRRSAVIDTVLQDHPAAAAGLKNGDVITSVNGQSIQYYDEFQKLMNKEDENTIVFLRGSQQDTIKVTPNEEGLIGVNSLGKDIISQLGKTEITYTLGESITGGFSYGYYTLRDYIAQFKYVFTKKGATQVGGFGAIGNLFPPVWDWQSFWATTALISIILAFMNILPIPALDGGHVMFLLYEIVSGRKPGDKFMEYAQMVGFFILIALVLFANGNDIYRWLFE
ncbi:RIP metalloprotease RseP [Aequorivita viscosa]|uniref:Zinc metalloprotease n=1 Tax=Aequorivita viscosa TaxID=797419 RepID=A0A1M6C488_9FLAO|nr:RIP metalloprotease RseP [Aequorivita viscosa]SDW23415.1 regulator of sigma E protease [Aequorivita viscosa]SHI55762.1 regulator of sigma E protease [Aequorivita viscosa]